MAYCVRCGAYIPEGQSICLACGYDPEAAQIALREKAEKEKNAKSGAAAARQYGSKSSNEELRRRLEEQRKRFGADWKNRESGVRNKTASGLSRSVSGVKSRLPGKKPDANSRRTTDAGRKRNTGDGRQNKARARPLIRMLQCAAMRQGLLREKGTRRSQLSAI